ncbi:MAG TPA: spore coat protein [Firmicutes bacterium]|nr:spore coat protein [Bacillota bacterium]
MPDRTVGQTSWGNVPGSPGATWAGGRGAGQTGVWTGAASGAVTQPDKVIAGDLLSDIKSFNSACALGINEATNPQVRDFFSRCLQDGMREHERLTQVMMQKGWYKPYEQPEQQLRNDMNAARQALNATQNLAGGVS